MNILIVGCGKIGTAVLSAMVAEGHDVTAVDLDNRVLSSISNVHDVMSVCGNGVNCELLQEAGVSSADVVISATGSDEVNLLCCFLAKQLGASHTVARVRNPEHSEKDLQYMREHLKISMIINPEQMAAQELFTLLKLPSAVKVETFSRRNFQMIEVRLKRGSPLDGVRIMDLRNQYKASFLICVIQRGDDVIIPDGQFVLREGDRIGISAMTSEIHKLLKELNLFQKQARHVMLLGGSRTSIYLARTLSEIGISVKILEQNEKRCQSLCEQLPKVDIIEGDGTQQELLQEEGIADMDAFVSLTGMDEENILMSYYASTLNIPTVVAKVNRSEMIPMASRLGLDIVISPIRTVTDLVTRYVRALQNSVGSNIETLYHLMDDQAEALEFIVRTPSRALNVPLRELKTKSGVLIAGIIRDRAAFIPGGDDKLLLNDRVVVVTSHHLLRDLTDILE